MRHLYGTNRANIAYLLRSGGVFMRTVLLCILVGLSAGALFAQDVRIEKTRTSPVETKFAANGRIRMDLCSAGIDVIGKEDDMLRVDADPTRGNTRVSIRVFGDRADVRVSGCPNNNYRVTIEIPKSSALQIRMFAGELNVNDVVGDKDVVLHFGELNIDMGKPEDYRYVEASVNSGDLEAGLFNVSKGGLFRSFDHTGPGKYRVHAHVGAGQLDLR